MTSAGVIFLWAWVIMKTIASPAILPEITDEGFMDECVREHNRARSSVVPAASDMLYMTWDKDLAMTAREWARKCTFEHNPDLKRAGHMPPKFSSVGENIWTGYPTTLFNATQAIQKWVDEKWDYDYNSNACNNVCGHYKQVVWAQTSKVGCAVHSCPKGVQATSFADKAGAIFVCNYASAGNVNGRRPYRSEGKFCSGCEGACLEKLCQVPERDSLQKLALTNATFVDVLTWGHDGSDVDTDWDSLENSADFNYGTILIIRPLGLIVTLATAYGLHQFYPNIFCYE